MCLLDSLKPPPSPPTPMCIIQRARRTPDRASTSAAVHRDVTGRSLTAPPPRAAAGQGRSPAGTSVTSLDLGSLTPACQDLHVVPAMVADHDAWGPATPVPETGALGGHPGGGKVKPPRPASVRNERSSGASSQAAGPESAVAGGSVASRGRTPSPKIGDHGAQSAGRGTGGSFPGFPSPQDHTGPVTLPRAWTVTRAGVPVVRLADAAPDARTAGAQVPSGGEGDVSIIIPRELFQASPGRGVVVAIPVPEMDGEASRREEDGEEAEGVTVRRRSGASLLQALPRREEGAEVAVGGTVHEGMAQIDADGDTDEETEEEGDEGETEGGDGGVVPAESESVLDEGLPDDAGLVVVGRAVRGVASFGEQAIAQIRAVARAHKTRAREALRALAALDKRHASLSRKAHAWRKELRQLRRRVATAEAQRDELSAHLARVAGGQADLKGVTGGTVGSERQDPSPKTPVVVSLQVESGGVIDAATVGVQVSPLVDAKAEVAVQVESGVLAETEKSCDEDCGHGDGAEGEDWSLKSGLDEAMVEEVKEEEVAGGAHMTETKTRAVEERVQIEDKEGAEDPCEHAQACQACGIDDGKKLVSCEGCDHAWHLKCAGLRRTPRGDWFCSLCEEGHAAEEKAREINNEQEHAGKGEEKDAREEMSAEEEDDSPCVECGKPDVSSFGSQKHLHALVGPRSLW